MKRARALLILFLLLRISDAAPSQTADQNRTTEPLNQLADKFWAWRTKYAPFTADDVNRIERPGGTRDWSRAAIDKHRSELEAFESEWRKLNPSQWPISAQVDHRLIGSALSRVRWELDINARWKRDPTFYIEQTLTPVVEALTVPGPYDAARSREILTRIENIPAIIDQARANLADPPQPFASVAIQALDKVRERLQKMASALSPVTVLPNGALATASDRAASALEAYRSWLQSKLATLPKESALGRNAYDFFLKNVA